MLCIDSPETNVYHLNWKTYWTNPLVMTNIATGNGPFLDGLPIKDGWIFHGKLLVITRWYTETRTPHVEPRAPRRDLRSATGSPCAPVFWWTSAKSTWPRHLVRETLAYLGTNRDKHVFFFSGNFHEFPTTKNGGMINRNDVWIFKAQNTMKL